MKRYKLTFEFEGTDFKGWQRQPDVRTVEGVIEDAFSKFYQEEINIIGQGRTDAGVHALAQTAHVDLPDRFTIKKIEQAMKGLLPGDVVLKGMEEVDQDFHARFHAVQRAYQYQVSTKPVALNRNLVWSYFFEPNIDLLHECADKIQGEHDFINFCIPNDEEYGTTICSITESRWREKDGLWFYEIEGNRFLRHMVRRLVGGMIKVSAGKININEFDRFLTGEEVRQKAFSAPAAGLILTRVHYT
ncbi:tRNA pseudouridine(38-40) synthase TruA [Rhodohalobacter sp.]|uniref:tRNA pseudouridine(38-40) synthase TruA n=1 Tax=Rhodohalobacter sp. TaxID=1974210 RepID=UPI002ACD5722|nr:tRNA pseudouridine(38-40) synthase TruA [Rhodohalobacter sp.]MDZ7755953.1 tRNA pseudouridine(38-40) synthase TruA [Rhodohalobacter sp.]